MTDLHRSDDHPRVFAQRVDGALKSLGILPSGPHSRNIPRAYPLLCRETALGHLDARILHRAVAASAVSSAVQLALIERIAVLGGYAQIFADDSAFPGHYIVFSNHHAYHLLERVRPAKPGSPIPNHWEGVANGAWWDAKLRQPTTEDHVGDHLYPLRPTLALIIAAAAHSTTLFPPSTAIDVSGVVFPTILGPRP